MNGPTNLPAEARRTIQRAAQETAGLLYHFTLAVTPRPFYRVRSRGRTKNPRALAYNAYKDALRHLAGHRELPADSLFIVFELPMPESWSAARRVKMLGREHQQTPDTENLLKAVVDALYPPDMDDAALSDEHGKKIWSDRGAIHVFTDLRKPSTAELYDVVRRKEN